MEKVINNVDMMKVGTNVLVRKHRDGSRSLDYDAFRRIGRQASGSGHQVLVTSAFIAAGMIATNTKRRPNRETEMPELQRLASIGALPILSAWDASIKQKNIGSVLLTRQELSEESDERDEALKVIHALLKHREVPVVNEDDSVSHEEISFGDNDILAATLAACMARSSLFGRVRLFLLSVTNGIYEDRHDPRSRIAVIENTDVYRHLAGESDSDLGSGGAASKIIAADIANAAGVDMWVFDPRSGSHRNQALRGQIGTYFPAHAVELSMGGTIT